MNKIRKKIMDEIYKYIRKLLPGDENIKIYENTIGKLSDKDFDSYMKKLESGEEILFLVNPNFSKNRLDLTNNVKIARELGVELFERLWLTDAQTKTTYLTNEKYLILLIPLKRQAQTLEHKLSVPKDNLSVDILTGQPTGPSKGAKLSFPELQTLYAQGLDKSLEELIRFRGGDEAAYREMNKEILRYGNVKLGSIYSDTRTKSTQTLRIILNCMHYDTTL